MVGRLSRPQQSAHQKEQRWGHHLPNRVGDPMAYLSCGPIDEERDAPRRLGYPTGHLANPSNDSTAMERYERAVMTEVDEKQRTPVRDKHRHVVLAVQSDYEKASQHECGWYEPRIRESE